MSVDRRGGPAAAKETVKLAEEFLLSTDGVVVGLDFSGNPTVSILIFTPLQLANNGRRHRESLFCAPLFLYYAQFFFHFYL